MASKTISTFAATRRLLSEGCAPGQLSMLAEALDLELPEEAKALDPLMGGIMLHGYQCGALWGAALAAGAKAHSVLGPGPQAELATLMACQRMTEAYQERNGSLDCGDINDLDLKELQPLKIFVHFFVKGGTIKCVNVCAQTANHALEAIEAAVEAPPEAASCEVVSCAAQLARRLGASELRVTMCAGLAGGIGLSGDACGALGAATWLLGLKMREGQGLTQLWGDKRFESRFESMVEQFLEAIDYEFECEKGIGRRFDTPEEHVEFLQGGGCAQVIEALARAVEGEATG
jgi:C_GCAxxG_C_C family probable redox protein